MIQTHFRAWKTRDGRWAIATHRRAKPFAYGPTCAAVMDCPQLIERRAKMKRTGYKQEKTR